MTLEVHQLILHLYSLVQKNRNQENEVHVTINHGIQGNARQNEMLFMSEKLI